MRLHQITEADVDTNTGEIYRWHDRYRLLQRYAGDPSVFVHFSDINKLGVNPGSGFDTPIGIYAYPVDYVLDPEGTGTPFGVPFAGNRQYAHVLRVRDLSRCLIVSDDSGSDYYYHEGEISYLDGVLDFIERFSYSAPLSVQNIFLPNDIPDAILKYHKNMLTNQPNVQINFSQLYDYIVGNHVDVNIPSYLPKFPGEDKVSMIVGGDLDRVKFATACLIGKYHIESGDDKLLWYFTMAAADVRSSRIKKSSHLKGIWYHNGKTGIPSKPSVVWSTIMRGLGISGVIDNGFCLIHPNEPVQAVFFDIRNLIHLDVIRNTYLSDRPGHDNFLYYNIAVSARHGDFRPINHFIKKNHNFADWIYAAIENVNNIIPAEFKKIIKHDTDEAKSDLLILSVVDLPWWKHLNNLAVTFENAIKMEVKKLVIYKKNGGDKYIEIRPVIVNSVNNSVKLIRDYFDNVRTWLDKNASHDFKYNTSLNAIKANLNTLYKTIAVLERSV